MMCQWKVSYSTLVWSWILFQLKWTTCDGGDGIKKSVEKLLIRDLLNRYKKYGVVGRPVNNSQSLVTVNYGLALVQILDLDENKQVLRTNCWSRYDWQDNLLTWDPRNYSGITQIRIFPHLIWTPDIKLYNFADERLMEHRNARVVINHKGVMLWIPQALFKSTCAVEITYFPFDIQYCQLEFGSWTYDITQLDIQWWNQLPYIDFEHYVQSNEWTTDGEKAIKNKGQIKSERRIRLVNVTDSDGRVIGRRYSTLRYKLRLKRNPNFYISILIVPCLLLSSLTLVLFWLPPESPAKMMLGMNIFVAFFVLLLLLAESTPSNVQNFPLIGALYCLNMTMITLSTFLACIVINLYFRGDRRGPVPSFIRRLFIEGLGRILLVRQNIPLASEKQINKCVDDLNADCAKKSSSNCNHHYSTMNHRSHSQTTAIKLQNYSLPTSPNQSTVYRHRQADQSTPANHYVPTRDNGNTLNPSFQPVGLTANATAAGDSYWSKAVPEYEDELDENAVWRARQQATCLLDPFDPKSPALSPNARQAIEKDISEVRRYIKLYVDRQKNSEQRNLISMQWRTVALVFDRLFFVIYFVGIAVSIVTLMPREKDTGPPPGFNAQF